MTKIDNQLQTVSDSELAQIEGGDDPSCTGGIIAGTTVYYAELGAALTPLVGAGIPGAVVGGILGYMVGSNLAKSVCH